MNKPKRYSPEVRERAVRMVFEHEREHGVAVGGDHIDLGEDRVLGRGAQELGPAGGARRGASAASVDGRA
jgi:hypothetical protein